MLSGELAELAGVTVRTLRHYHQIGVLPEPPRSAGGYRHYDVRHVVRLLRITRMTALGVPLAALPEVLDDRRPPGDCSTSSIGRRSPRSTGSPPAGPASPRCSAPARLPTCPRRRRHGGPVPPRGRLRTWPATSTTS
jgi:DNA-binding transcriptional MerR regulator